MKQLRMKVSFLLSVFLFSTFVVGFVNPNQAYGQAALDIEAESAILVDANSGKVLYAKDADVTLPPASMTKMMTEYLVLEAIENGTISWDTTTQISDYAYKISANIAFSGVGLRQNKDYTVRELYDAMAIYSDNATTIALAELIAGSEGEFVKLMNKKAEELNLQDYSFVNSTGLSNSDLGDDYPEGTDPEADNLLSPRATARLAYSLINDFPESLEISSTREKEFEDQMMQNWNWMLPDMPGYLAAFGYEGVDGLKTGYTNLAGYCFAGTAERNGQRLISVVMRTDSRESRFQETKKLFDYGFGLFDQVELYPEGYQIEDQKTLPVSKGKVEEVSIATNESVTSLIQPGDQEFYTVSYEFDEELLDKEGKVVAPIEKGQKVGTMKITYEGVDNYGYLYDDVNNALSVDLVTTEAVEKASWFSLFFSSIGNFFSDIFTSIADTIKGWF
ncbi:D-alanyl-D-alanine carboxypeptidase family protein [Bacillaceae bacterium S4-13-58]